MKDKYHEPTIVKYGNATVKVFRPILTEDEYNRRLDNIKKECGRFMREYERVKAKKIVNS